MDSGKVGLVIVASTICVVLTVHGCNRDCGSVSYGMHPDDVVKATVIGPYYSGDAGVAVDGGPSPCAGFDHLLSGAEVIWKANVMPFGEGCDCTETLQDMGIEAFNGQPVQQSGLAAFVDAGRGCVGELTADIGAPSQDVSIFAPQPDAGRPPWALVLTFTPMPDASMCPIGPQGCSDSFIARCTKQ
ncbi:MAG: hypothetical protein ACRENE_17495 [Polyangiaceae bacterium]